MANDFTTALSSPDTGRTPPSLDGPMMSFQDIQALARRIHEPLSHVVYGQDDVLDLILVGLLSEGHMLLEGVPGTAKTTLVKALSQLIEADFQRVQLTPDMLPAEILGTSIYEANQKDFIFRKGPVFTDLLLADEINRTPPKTQSALLEAMEEYQVSMDGTRHALSPIFTVIATLNPVEFEGTYPLPEAQLDRFMMKILVSYPDAGAEKQMIESFLTGHQPRRISTHHLRPVCTREDILAARRGLSQIRLESMMVDYILALVHDTRKNPLLTMGCSPRAALTMVSAVRAYAALNGQDFVTPDHVKAIAPAVLRHRLLLSAEAELDGLSSDQILEQTLARIPVPR